MSYIQISKKVVYSCRNRQVGHSTLFSVDFISHYNWKLCLSG